jgi:hypothetical protein
MYYVKLRSVYVTKGLIVRQIFLVHDVIRVRAKEIESHGHISVKLFQCIYSGR